MPYLLDTSILARLANASDVNHGYALQAVLELHRRGEVLHIAPQILIEFRNVATRSVAVNGLALSTADAGVLAATFEAKFAMLVETPDIYPMWKSIVSALNIVGKQVHDARLAAICHVHKVTHVLTFNVGHFSRLATVSPGLVVVDPVGV